MILRFEASDWGEVLLPFEDFRLERSPLLERGLFVKTFVGFDQSSSPGDFEDLGWKEDLLDFHL